MCTRNGDTFLKTKNSIDSDLKLELLLFDQHILADGGTWFPVEDSSLFYLFIFGHATPVGSLVLKQGSNVCPLHWEHRVLTTGWPGKSLETIFPKGRVRQKEASTKPVPLRNHVLSPGDRGGWESKLGEVKWSEVAQSCPTLCNPMDCSLPGSSVPGILQAGILEWVAISFSRRSPQPRDWTWVSRIAGRRFTIWATREVGKATWHGEGNVAHHTTAETHHLQNLNVSALVEQKYPTGEAAVPWSRSRRSVGRYTGRRETSSPVDTSMGDSGHTSVGTRDAESDLQRA